MVAGEFRHLLPRLVLGFGVWRRRTQLVFQGANEGRGGCWKGQQFAGTTFGGGLFTTLPQGCVGVAHASVCDGRESLQTIHQPLLAHTPIWNRGDMGFAKSHHRRNRYEYGLVF